MSNAVQPMNRTMCLYMDGVYMLRSPLQVSKHFDCLRRGPIFLETDNVSVIILYVMLKLLIITLLLYMVWVLLLPADPQT